MAFWLVVPFLWPLFFFGSRGLFCASFAFWFSAGDVIGLEGSSTGAMGTWLGYAVSTLGVWAFR